MVLVGLCGTVDLWTCVGEVFLHFFSATNAYCSAYSIVNLI